MTEEQMQERDARVRDQVHEAIQALLDAAREHDLEASAARRRALEIHSAATAGNWAKLKDVISKEDLDSLSEASPDNLLD